MYFLGLVIVAMLATFTLFDIAYTLAMTTNPNLLGGWFVVYVLTCPPILFGALGWFARSCKVARGG